MGPARGSHGKGAARIARPTAQGNGALSDGGEGSTLNPLGTVLIVDDSVLMCAIIAGSCEELGFRAVTANSGTEALQFLAEWAAGVDLVITDVLMPDTDGFELMARLHGLYPDLPVVLMTAHASVDLVIRAIKQRALDVLVKPVSPPQLEQALRTALERRDLLSEERGLLETLRRTVEDQNAELRARMQAIEQHRLAEEQEHQALKRLFGQVRDIKEEWESTMDCVADMVLLVDPDGKLKRCNRALRDFTGLGYRELLGADCKDLLRSNGLTGGSGTRPPGPEADRVTIFTSGMELHHAATARWFVYREAPFASSRDKHIPGTVVTIHDTTELKLALNALEDSYQKLQDTQAQVIQSEKLATIGQLTAGMAHEINNPVGFVTSNLNTLNKYIDRLVTFMAAQADAVNKSASPRGKEDLADVRRSLKIDYILTDVRKLLAESLDGTSRVSKIVKDLGSFSRVDTGERAPADLTECIERGVTIVWNELKYKVTLHRDYGDVPKVVCNMQQINQVVMNLLVNASHAMDKPGEITLSTRVEGSWAVIRVADTGKGIAPEHLAKIFEPFFTTKEAGKGTGLGLSISFDIIKQHGGDLSVESTVGLGTTFTIRLPLVS